jgi:hypothetical protein
MDDKNGRKYCGLVGEEHQQGQANTVVLLVKNTNKGRTSVNTAVLLVKNTNKGRKRA